MTTDFDRDEAICFGPFRLSLTRRQLFEGDRDAGLGSRAMDILLALLEHPGKLLSKRELMTIVWPDTAVVEANLTVHVAALRRALRDGQEGNRYIINTPGRGYRFVGSVESDSRPLALAPPAAAVEGPHNLPARLTRLIGREDVVSNAVRQMPAQRLLTIVGPPGIGKTATALDVARRMTAAYKDGVWRLDLAQIRDPVLLPTALISVLKPEGRSEDPLPELIADAKDKQMLLVLDNCDPVIDAAAALADDILKGSHGVQILATSREPLRVEGERVVRLPPLESPPAFLQLSAAEALAYPAVELLVHSISATVGDFALTDADVSSAGKICRKLDGIPLAIQLAACRVLTFGIRGLAARMDDPLRLLNAGCRTALPRHRSITAAFDWSYQQLSREEQMVLRRLATFSAGFTLEAAAAVVADSDRGWPDVADSVTSLMMKSLVVTDVGERPARFRLLETTKAYARAKLAESDEFDMISERRAHYYQDVAEAAYERTSVDELKAGFKFEVMGDGPAWSFASEATTDFGGNGMQFRLPGHAVNSNAPSARDDRIGLRIDSPHKLSEATN